MERLPASRLNRAPTRWYGGKNAVTELLKSGGAVDTVYLADSLPQPVAGYYTALAKQTGAVVKRVPGHKLQRSAAPMTTRAWPPAPPRCSMPRWRICLPLLGGPKAKHRSWCCAMGRGPLTTWVRIIARLYRAAPTAWSFPKRGGSGVTGTVMKSSAGAATACRWLACPTWRRPSALLRSITSRLLR